MKQLIPLFALLFLLPFSLTAQLSGTYTVGGASSHYATLPDALHALNVHGLSGDVVFRIRSGVYPGPVFASGGFPGSGVFRVTIESFTGNRADVTLQTGTGSLTLDGTSRFSFRNLTVSGSVAAVKVYAADQTVFEKCALHAGNAPALYADGSTQLRVSSCSLNGETGCRLIGNVNILLHDNSFGPSAGGYYLTGIHSTNNAGMNLMRNSISQFRRYGICSEFDKDNSISQNSVTSSQTVKFLDGILFKNPGGVSRISANKIRIEMAETVNGLMYDSFGYEINRTGAETSIHNNFISVSASLNGEALSVLNYNLSSKYAATASVDVIHNSVHVFGLSEFTIAPFRLFDQFQLPSNHVPVRVLNNIFSNSNFVFTSGAINAIAHIFDMDAGTNPPNLTVNYNNYSGQPGNPLVYSAIGIKYFFHDWQTTSGFDHHSITIVPGFISDTDLHTSETLLASGTGMPYITTDIDGQPRNAITPWMGADEGVSYACGVHGDKVLVCHIPPGKPSSAHTICIAAAAVPAHLAHGCTVGPCAGVHKAGAFGMDDGVLNVSPNPFSDQITLEYGSLHTENMTVSIYSITGQLVKAIEISNVQDGVVNSTTLNTQDLPSGMYLARFSYAGTEITKKIVKE